MVPPLPETLLDDAEFDLDVRLQAVARHSDEPGQRATEITCVEGCSQGGQFSCNCK
jgi:hypothetical protein